jgi:hypothetical protein
MTYTRKRQETRKTRTRKMRKKGGDKSEKQCMDTKCQLWLKQAEENTKKFRDKMLKSYKKTLKKNCNEKTPKCQKEIKDLDKKMKNFDKAISTNKSKDLELKICKKYYCNKGCKETILEDGEPDILPKSLLKQFKNDKDILDNLRKTRKELFGKKKSVLKDGFFEGIKSKTLKNLKKEGAISGCVRNL